MRMVWEALRLGYDQRRSQRESAARLALSQSSVHDYVARFQAAGLTWPLLAAMDEAALRHSSFGGGVVPAAATHSMRDWAAVHRKLTRKGVTCQLLWAEYEATAPDGCQYARFCRRYGAWVDTREPVLRQLHVASEWLFVDYAELTMPVVDPTTAAERLTQVFVDALGTSQLLNVEATRTQALPDWIGAHVRMLAYVGSMPGAARPGQPQACGRPAVVLRADGARDQSGLGEPLWHHSAARRGISPTRQGQGRDRGADRGARNPGPAAPHRRALRVD